MNGFAITSAGADMEVVAALFREYAAFLNVDLVMQGFDRELAGLPGAYVPPGGALLLARDAAGAALGCIALKPLAPGVGEIKRLYVRQEARGLGVGKSLIAAVLEEAGRLGYREVKLDTLPKLKGAIALYRSFNFSPVPPYGSHPYPGLLYFGKRLF